MDALGHVNNCVHIRWYESSRINYLEQSGVGEMLNRLRLGPILAAVNCNYRRQLLYPDLVQVSCRMSRLGRSSMTLQHIVFSERLGEVAADGESVVVVFDYKSQRPVRVPEEVHGLLSKYQSNIPKS